MELLVRHPFTPPEPQQPCPRTALCVVGTSRESEQQAYFIESLGFLVGSAALEQESLLQLG